MSSVEECENGLGDEINGRTSGVFVMEHFFLCRHSPVLSLYDLLQFTHDNASRGFFKTYSSVWVAKTLFLCFMVLLCFIKSFFDCVL